MLRAFGHPVGKCCDKLRHVGWCWLKFETGKISHAPFVDVACCCGRLARFVQKCCARACALVRFSIPTMWQHLVTWWPKACNMLRPTLLRSVAFKCCHRLVGGGKCWANNIVVICCVEMLLSFGRGLSYTLFWTRSSRFLMSEFNWFSVLVKVLSSVWNRWT